MEKNKKAVKEEPTTVNKPYKPRYDKKAEINNEVSDKRNDAKQLIHNKFWNTSVFHIF